MRLLIARYLDRMPNLDGIEFVGIERIGREQGQIRRIARAGTVNRPAGKAAADKRHHDSGGDRRPGAAPAARQPGDVEPPRRNFVLVDSLDQR